MTRLIFALSLACLCAGRPAFADDSPSIQALLDSGRSVQLPAGRYTIGRTLRVTTDGQTLAGSPGTVLVCAGDVRTGIEVVGRRGVVVRDLEVDCDRTGRPGLTTRTVGIALTGDAKSSGGCNDCRVENCTVRGTVGGSDTAGGPALVGMGILAFGTRLTVSGCTVTDCGVFEDGKTSDGIYMGGWDSTIIRCTAVRTTDTGFAIENADRCSVIDCTAEDVISAAGISCARDTPCTGNTIRGLKVQGWSRAVTGGIFLGCPVAASEGDLRSTTIEDATIAYSGETLYDAPAIHARRTRNDDHGCIDGLLVRDVRVIGSGTQGMAFDAERVTVENCTIERAGWNGIQVRSPARSVAVRNCAIGVAGGYGVYVEDGAHGVEIRGNTIRGRRPGMLGGIGPIGTGSDVEAGGNVIEEMPEDHPSDTNG